MNHEKTSIEKLSTMNLEGLFLPEPVPASYTWLWMLLACLLAVGLWVWRKKYNAPKATALRDLKRLSSGLRNELTNEMKDSQVDSVDIDDIKAMKQQIALSLRQGFEVTRLDRVLIGNTEWRDYLTKLEKALYSNKKSVELGSDQNAEQGTELTTLSSLIAEAEKWLRKGEKN